MEYSSLVSWGDGDRLACSFGFNPAYRVSILQQVRSNMQTFRDWMVENLSDCLPDIVEHGCAAGFPGLTYYSETCSLYARHKHQIWDALVEDADSMGYSSVTAMIADFNGAEQVVDATTFKNLLVWYMAERIAREEMDRREGEELTQC